MSLATVERAIYRAVEAGIVGSTFTVVWHAGEPLVMPRQFYADATYLVRSLLPETTTARTSVQTNGTLLDDEWCKFFRANDFRVGLSLDGPSFLHDANRRTRKGGGTFDKAFAGLRQLQRHRVDHHVLSVLTHQSLAHADEMYDFFYSNGVRSIGFNVEEIEGENKSSSLQKEDSEVLFTMFMNRFYDRCAADAGQLRVREFRHLESFLIGGTLRTSTSPTQQTTPYRILAVDCDGCFTTFSPELLGMKDLAGGDFVLGNLETTDLRSALMSPKGKALCEAIHRGKELCECSCEFFPVCGGGSPSNKYSENQTFESTETLQCRLRVKCLTNVVLNKLEASRLVPQSH